jgi:pilus assembly protein FimV
MPQFRRQLLPFCVATLLAGQAGAIGLGDIRLQSHLGRPLEAVIPLTHVGDLDASQIRVSIASADEYERLGVEYDYLHSQLRLQPVIEGRRGHLRLLSTQPVVEPFLNVVVTLRWPSGQLSREYVLLLDPPPAVAAPVASTQPRPPASAAASPRVGGQVGPASAAATSTAPADGGRYFTSRGDNLWRIAERLRPAGVPVAQMMDALLAANPEAFVGGDPGRLREAVYLDVPDAEGIRAAAAATPAAKSLATAGSRPVAGDRVAARVPPPAEPDAADGSAGEQPPPSGGRLELVAPVDPEQLLAENSELKGEVLRLSGHVGQLNDQLVRSEQRLAQLEQRLNQVVDRYDGGRESAPVSPPVAGSPFADGGAAAAVPAPQQQPRGEGVAAAPVLPAEPRTPWWMHLIYWLAIGAVAGWALYQQGRGRRRQASAMAQPRPEPIVVAPPAAGATRVQTADAGATGTPASALAPESDAEHWNRQSLAEDELPLDLMEDLPPASPGPKPAPPAGTFVAATQSGTGVADEGIDASISAGVFLAFGRFPEAEQVLTDALRREPDRTDLKLQLLDVYQQADNRGAFEALAAELEQSCGDQPEVAAELAILRESYLAR